MVLLLLLPHRPPIPLSLRHGLGLGLPAPSHRAARFGTAAIRASAPSPLLPYESSSRNSGGLMTTTATTTVASSTAIGAVNIAIAQQPSRPSSTTTTSSSTSASASSPSPQQTVFSAPPRKNKPHTLAFYLFLAATTAATAYAAGHAAVESYLGGASPPGTLADAAKLAEIHAEFETLPIVRRLRAAGVTALEDDAAAAAAAAAVVTEKNEKEGRNGAEVGAETDTELDRYEEWEAYDGFDERTKATRITSGALHGSRGLALQRIFWNARKKENITVIYLGNGLSGWPGIIHGGLQSIILDEGMGRVALNCLPARTGVTAHLSLNYRAPLAARQFATLTARLDRERSTDRKAFVTAEIRDANGKVCTQAEALFVVPKKFPLRQLPDKY